MVSKRNFFSIVIMMGILLFLFQFSLLMKDSENEYNKNDKLAQSGEDSASAWEADEVDLTGTVEAGSRYVIYIGSENEELKDTVSQWCLYTKSGMAEYAQVADCPELPEVLPQMIVLESGSYQTAEDIAKIRQMAEKGAGIVFSEVEQSVLPESEELAKLLGIEHIVAEETQISGIKIFEEFFLGGEVTYQAQNEQEAEKNQDLNLNVPWYIPGSGTKVYMVGLMQGTDVKNENLPALIWRNAVGKGKVFAVCGNYLDSNTGIGILDGILTETQEYTIYPVVNAQNLSVVNFPGFASENNEVMEQMYSRTQVGVYRDILWPGLVAVSDQNNLKLTCFVMPQFNYLDGIEPDSNELIFYLKQFKEVGAEAGFSLEYIKGVSLADKIKRDGEFFASQNSTYRYGAAFVNEAKITGVLSLLSRPLLSDVTSIVCEYTEKRPVLSYCGERVVLQMATNDAVSHTYTEDLRMRSLQSALAYCNIMLDMQKISWPQTEADSWQVMYDKFSSNLNTYWKGFSGFSATTVSESDVRVRNFLNMDYQQERNGDMVSMHISGEPGYFILQTHGEEIADTSGAEWTKLEDNAWLIKAEKEDVTIELKKQELYYYLPE